MSGVVVSTSYDRLRKLLTVHFDDGSKKTYSNVSSVNACAIEASESKHLHWKKYIDPCYLKANDATSE